MSVAERTAATQPEFGDRAATGRDDAASVRDRAAEARDAAAVGSHESEPAAGDRLLSAGDRAASALDRQGSAADRHGAASRLQNAYRDSLTGLLVRDAGRDQLSRALDRARRGEPLVIAFLDVDHLKQVNDTRGHAAGDQVLREVAAALRQCLRSYDVVVRYGGDEFVCALLGARLIEAQRRFADVDTALMKAIGTPAVSIGMAELEVAEGLDEVIDRADHDMYDRRRARRAGLSSVAALAE